jgi:hypothetical protein
MIRARHKKSGRTGPNRKWVKAQSERGVGEVIIKQTHHNTKERSLTNFPSLLKALQNLRQAGLFAHGHTPTTVSIMLAGVTINSRRWSQGMGCEFCLPGDSGETRVGQVQCFALLDLEGDTEEGGLFLMVSEHIVIKRSRRVTYIEKDAARHNVFFPVQCLTFAMKLLEHPGERPQQGPLEEDENFDKRMRRQ